MLALYLKRQLWLKLCVPALLAAGAVGVAAPGRAALPVFDASAVARLLQQIRQMQQQYQVTLQQYQTLTQSYQTLRQSYNAIAHLPQNVTKELGQQLAPFRNPFGSNGSVIIGVMMDGSGVGQGPLGELQARFANANRVYAPEASDFAARQLNRAAASVAGSQALASQLYQSAQDHATALQGIEVQLATAPDAKAVADLQARAATETAYFQAHSVQSQALAIWQQAQLRSEDQRRRERRRQQIDALIAAARAQGAGA